MTLEIRTKVREIILKVLGVDVIGMDFEKTLNDFGADDLDHLLMMLEIESYYKLKDDITDEEWNGLSIIDICGLIKTKLDDNK